MFKILISKEAKFDIERSFLYYKEEAGTNVAKNFMKDFRNSVDVLSKNPFFRVWYDDFRAKPMKKFPFVVFFIVDEIQKTILISRVFHTSLNPEKYP